MILARLMPGTPLAAILDMDVGAGVDWLLAAAALQAEQTDTAGGDRETGAGEPATTSIVGAGGRRIERVTGGLDVLRSMMKR